MKIRWGFVSNSSTTSFVVIASIESYQKALDGEHPYIRAVANAFMSPRVILGIPAAIFTSDSDATLPKCEGEYPFTIYTSHGIEKKHYIDNPYDALNWFLDKLVEDENVVRFEFDTE